MSDATIDSKAFQYTNYPPNRDEMVYFVPITGKKLATIAYLVNSHQIPAENLTENQREDLESLRSFVHDTQEKHEYYYNAVFAPENTPESDTFPHG